MRYGYTLLIPALLALASNALACSCFGPQTFCETLNPQPPQFPEPQWWIPSDIVLAVKLGDYQYGADMKVVQVFSGDLEPNQTIRVWGDCGLLCRHYVNGGAVGDTVLWSLQPCDLSGNGPCGTNFEDPDDYQLSICGVYWLDYADGIVSGSLLLEGWAESISLSTFNELVNGCLPTSVEESVAPTASIRCVDDQLTINTTGTWNAEKEVCITDLAGRVVHEARFRGAQGTMLLPRRIVGLALVRVSDGQRTVAQKILFD